MRIEFLPSKHIRTFFDTVSPCLLREVDQPQRESSTDIAWNGNPRYATVCLFSTNTAADVRQIAA